MSSLNERFQGFTFFFEVLIFMRVLGLLGGEYIYFWVKVLTAQKRTGRPMR